MHERTLVESFVGQTARRTRVVTARDIELFTEMTGDDTVVLDGTALVYQEPLGATS